MNNNEPLKDLVIEAWRQHAEFSQADRLIVLPSMPILFFGDLGDPLADRRLTKARWSR